MPYSVETSDVAEEINALSHAGRVAFAEAMTLLEVDPWSVPPLSKDNPNGPVRALSFGDRQQGLLVVLVLEDQRRVDVVSLQWADLDTSE